ncbi:DNA helicase [Tanacetum coccineum]
MFAVSATNKPSTPNAHKPKYLQPVSTLWSKEGSFSRNIKKRSMPSSLQQTLQPNAPTCHADVLYPIDVQTTVTTVNHAYLCLDVKSHTIRPEIISFLNDNQENVNHNYASAEHSNDCCMFKHTEVSATIEPLVLHGCKRRWSDSLSTISSKKNSSSRNVKRRSRSEEGNAFYRDLGDCEHQCRHCGCLFWYDERLKGNNYSRQAEYHLCCGGGKIYMPPQPEPPVFIQQLLSNSHFIEHIRAYNQMFAMTSFEAKVDDSVNRGRGPYVFKISGQIYHWIGSLCPEEGEIPGMKIRLYNKGGVRGYELPTTDTLGAIVFEDGPKSRTDFDVIIEFRGGPPQRISKLHQSYMSLQFPLLFTFNQPGIYPELVLKPRDGRGRGKKVTMNAYYKYQLHPRVKDFGLIFRSGRLFQQYVVTVFCLYDAVSRGYREGIEAGSMIMLPSTFTGGPRYMYNHYLDALAICHSKTKIQSATQIDEYISAEIPDPAEDPTGYKVVTELMMHGPCGSANLGAACKSRLDNSNVVPYNPALCLAFHAHINVKYCGWSMFIKYLFKYISKGPNHILAKINRPIGEASTSTTAKTKPIDEIQNYVDGRFVCPFEACWRIFDYPIHSQEPAVQILNVHLENKQRVNFRNIDRLDVIVNLPDKKKTTLTEWYVYNNENTDDRHLTYLDFPSEFVWYANSKRWHRRVVKTKKLLGRLTYVHPSSGDLFYFRLLLSHQKGCKSPVEVRTVNEQIYPTYRAACEALGLLGDDREWDIALEESAVLATSSEIRTLFAQLLIYCEVSDPPKLWRKHWQAMRDDIPAKVSEATGIPNYNVNTAQLQDYILYELEGILNEFGKSVKEFGLPSPPESLLKDLKNKLMREKKNYKRDLLMQDAAQFIPKLNCDKKEVYDLIINASKDGRQVKLPLDLTDESVCHAKNSQLVNLLVETNLIIWDEAPMNDRRCFEALDRTLRDLMNEPDLLFGGKTIVLGGDFRQTLSVKKGAAKEELIHACIAESYLWLHFKICTLKTNMQLFKPGLDNKEHKRLEAFAKWLLDIGNGEIGESYEEDD